MQTEFIAEIQSHETGGNCSVDLVVLKDGRVLGINDECVVLYASMDDFNEGQTLSRQSIDLVQA